MFTNQSLFTTTPMSKPTYQSGRAGNTISSRQAYNARTFTTTTLPFRNTHSTRFNGVMMAESSTKQVTETASVIPNTGLTPGQAESKISAAEVTKVFNPSGKDQAKVDSSQASKGNQNAKTEGGVKMKGLSEDQFYAQKGMTALRNISEKEFSDIFAQQIREGEISESWRSRFQNLFAQPPSIQEGLAMKAVTKKKQEIAKKTAKKNPILTEEFQKLDLKAQALIYHEEPVPGKYEIKATKLMRNAADLTLAYSPGVAEPCKVIQEDPSAAYKYTGKGNMVAVITNGTAVLGLGNIGALASKPVMEGKSVLLNKFGGVNSIDICIDEEDPETFINIVKKLGPSFGGINLEDIKGPECFHIEETLKELMDIPVFHDDQHGTAIVCLAGLINALTLQNKKIEDVKVVMNGAGAAGIACIKLIQNYGAKPENCYLCDSQGVIYKGREKGMNSIKEQFAVETDARSLADAAVGADVLIGVSQAGLFTDEIVMSLGADPVIFAMANPNPEVTPTHAKELRDDIIIATGRSDYPNQINNVMCFPFLFRAALDTRATKINEEMKLATAKCLAEMAQNPQVEEDGTIKTFGKEYIIPTPFDPRLVVDLPEAIAKAAMESGVAQKNIEDWDAYRMELKKIQE